MAETIAGRDSARATIITAAADLLSEHGPVAVTTRGVAEAAGVQAPTIYRLFGDKNGLLEAVAEHVLSTYVSGKAAVVRAAALEEVDPLEDLRAGWRTQIEFGLANPTLFRLLSDPDRAALSPAAATGRNVLAARIHRVALSGRLRVGEQRAAELVHAAGVGTVFSLLASPGGRDPALADAMFEAVLGQILTDPPDREHDDPTATAVAFRAVVPDLSELTPGERQLMTEWLDRVIG